MCLFFISVVKNTHKIGAMEVDISVGIYIHLTGKNDLNIFISQTQNLRLKNTL